MAFPTATRRSRRLRIKSEFLTMNEIALVGDALGAEPESGVPSHAGSDTLPARGSEKLRILRLNAAWGRAVGPHLRSVSRPCFYRASSLVVEVKDVAWKRELERLGPEILSRLARILPGQQVSRITFRLEAATSAPRVERPVQGECAALPTAVTQRAAACGDLAGEPLPSVESVADGPLRDRLRQVMGRYLSRRA